MAIRISVQPRGKPIRKLPNSIELDPSTPLDVLIERLAAHTGLDKHRLRVTQAEGGAVLKLSTKQSVSEAGLKDGTVVQVKDLGPQIGWRLVYFIEYLGPLVIHPLFYYTLRPFAYPWVSPSDFNPPSSSQWLLMVLCFVHFLKREYETLFVHKFSAATMPFNYVFRNSAHYWLLGGIFLAWGIQAPFAHIAQPAHWANKPEVQIILTGLFTVFELCNMVCHFTLANLRPKGSTARVVPKGFGFGAVTCPNYSFEILSWLVVTVMSGFSWAAVIFWAVGSFTMLNWAKGKEKRNRREFGTAYKAKKFVLFPGII